MDMEVINNIVKALFCSHPQRVVPPSPVFRPIPQILPFTKRELVKNASLLLTSEIRVE